MKKLLVREENGSKFIFGEIDIAETDSIALPENIMIIDEEDIPNIPNIVDERDMQP